MDTKDIVKNNFDEFFELAQLAFKTKKFNAAVTLYYKALVELCDLSLLESLNRIGANHSERFLLLKTAKPELYDLSSKLFRFYRDSYSKSISPTIAEVVKNEVDKAKQLVLSTEKDKELDK